MKTSYIFAIINKIKVCIILNLSSKTAYKFVLKRNCAQTQWRPEKIIVLFLGSYKISESLLNNS